MQDRGTDMFRANKERIKKRALQAFPDYGRKTAEKSRPGWSEGLAMVGGALMDMDGTMGGGNMQGAMTRTQQKLRLQDQEKQAELDEKRRQIILSGMKLSPQQQALMQLGKEDRSALYGMTRDAKLDQRDENRYVDTRADRSSDVEHRNRVFEHGVDTDDRNFDYRQERDGVGDEQWMTNFNRGAFESDRAHDMAGDQFDHRKTVDHANLGIANERLGIDRAKAEADAAKEDSPYSAAEIRAMREKGEQLTGFQNSLDTYLKAIEEGGVQAWDIGGRNKNAARLDAMRQDLLFQGKNLWELGVLSKDDYVQMERSIPDATGVGVAIAGKGVALQKATPLKDSISYQLSRLPEEYRSYIPDNAGGQLQNAPPAGTVSDGYRFIGGDPADQNNWERVS